MEPHEIIQLGRDLEAMQEGPGWVKVKEYIEGQKQDATERILTAKTTDLNDLIKIARYQDRVETLNGIINFIAEAIQAGKETQSKEG